MAKKYIIMGLSLILGLVGMVSRAQACVLVEPYAIISEPKPLRCVRLGDGVTVDGSTSYDKKNSTGGIVCPGKSGKGIDTFIWEWGDYSTTTGRDPNYCSQTHYYQSPGRYTIKLKVKRGSYESKNDESVTVYVSETAKGMDPNGTTDEPINTTLRWTADSLISSYDIYLGTSVQDLVFVGNHKLGEGDNEPNEYDMRQLKGFLFADGIMTDIGSLGDPNLGTPPVVAPTWTGANSINDAGDIVGYSYNADGYRRAVIKQGSVMEDIITTEPTKESEAYDINDPNKWIVGRKGAKAFCVKDIAATPVYLELSDLTGDSPDANSVAYAINNPMDGSVPMAVGCSRERAVIWTGLDSGSPSPYDLGTVESDHNSCAYDINNYGHIVGYYYPRDDGDPDYKAFIGYFADSTHHALMRMGTGKVKAGHRSRAWAINNLGQVVGEATIDADDQQIRAFVYDGCDMQDISDRINDPNWCIVSARDINDDGCIVGYGTREADPSYYRAVMLVPMRPIAYWPLDESTGTIAGDMSIRGNHATVSGGYWTSGRMRGGLEFDGTDDYALSAAKVLDPNKTDFTVALWVNPHAVSSRDLVSQENGTVWLQINNEGRLQTQLGGSPVSGTTVLAADTWSHVVMCCSRSAGGYWVTYYVNGSKEGAEPQTLGTIVSVAGVLVLGSNASYNGEFFDGVMDEVQIFPWELSEAEVGLVYSGEGLDQ